MEAGNRKYRFELLEAIVLSMALVASAWSAYQAAGWSGIQSLRLGQAGAESRKALERHLTSQEQFIGDGVGCMHVIDALVEGKQNVIDFYIARMRQELRAAVEAWLACKPLTNPGAPAHPLVMPQYLEGVIGVWQSQERHFQDQADRFFELARDAKSNSDRYVLFNVLLAAVLFFTGVAGKFHLGKTRTAMLFLAAVVLFAVLGLMIRAPMAAG